MQIDEFCSEWAEGADWCGRKHVDGYLKPYVCEQCEEGLRVRFSSKGLLNRHKRENHAGDAGDALLVYMCKAKSCNKVFKRKSGCVDHFKRTHSRKEVEVRVGWEKPVRVSNLEGLFVLSRRGGGFLKSVGAVRDGKSGDFASEKVDELEEEKALKFCSDEDGERDVAVGYLS